MKIPTGLLITLLAGGLAATTMIHAGNDGANTEPGTERDWLDLIASMDKMHMTTETIAPSGNRDIDFAKLMLPHHQAAVDMARIQLQYGRDPEMRSLAEKILADQQSEIRFIEHWLKQQQSPQVEIKPTDPANPAKADLL